MFLSKLCPNLRNRQVRRDIAQPYELHRTLWRAFPDKDPGRILFRLEPDRQGTRPIILVQSEFEPNWDRLPGDDYLAEPLERKPFNPTFAAGQQLRFRLRANPTKKVGSASKAERLAGKKDHGQRHALLREEEQVAWLLQKGKQGGFNVPGDWQEHPEGRKGANFRVEVVPEGWVQCGKDGHADGRFFAVRFDGLLVVSEPQRFRQTLSEGLGSAKAFGFGLLSVAPLGG